MPRGFLVKRTRRCSASYRTRNTSKTTTSTTTPEPESFGPEEDVLNVFPLDGLLLPVSREESCGVRDAWSPQVESALEAEADRSAQLPDTEEDVLTPDSDFSCFFPPPPPPPLPPHDLIEPRSPGKPRTESRCEKLFPGKCLTSSPELPELPFLVSSAPMSASIERLLAPSYDPGHLFPPLSLMNQDPAVRKRSFLDPDPRRHTKQNPKKPKVNRKLSFEDEVTTSPVLGLRIKKESPELRRPPRDKSSGNRPLGEFICQLCKEEYPDPFSLAQHRCSRIVRVEYRCPECDKVFSCPANLASHRRWHKPRPVPVPAAAAAAAAEGPGGKLKERVEVEGKENELLRINQHHPPLDSVRIRREMLLHGERESRAPPPPQHYEPLHYRNPVESCLDLQQVRAADSPPSSLLLLTGNPEERADLPTSLPHPPLPFVQSLPEEEVYECRYCGKKFRRQAYLRKHLAAHEMTARASSPPPPARDPGGGGGGHVLLCHLCGARFPSAEIRDKHRLWHAMRDELLAGIRPEVFHAQGEEEEHEQQQIFTCKQCPSTFFSSPGLARHVNKSHPPENRPENRQVMLLQMTVRP